MSGNTRRSSCIVKYVLSFHSYSCKSNFATLKLEELSSWSYSFAVRDLTIGNNYRVSWLNFLVWVRAQGQWARLLSQARTFPTHPLRFLILCTFNSKLNCDLFILIFDIMQLFSNFVSAAQCLLMCNSSIKILIHWWLLSKMLKVSLS